MISLLAVAMTLAMVSAGCSGRNGKGGGPAATSCEASRAHIQSLYRQSLYRAQHEEQRAQTSEGDSAATDREILDELIAANIHMIEVDCATDPSRFVPCIQHVKTVTQLEAECVIPLDDDGRVEAAQFAIAH